MRSGYLLAKEFPKVMKTYVDDQDNQLLSIHFSHVRLTSFIAIGDCMLFSIFLNVSLLTVYALKCTSSQPAYYG